MITINLYGESDSVFVHVDSDDVEKKEGRDKEQVLPVPTPALQIVPIDSGKPNKPARV